MQREEREVIFARVPESLKAALEEVAVRESMSLNDAVIRSIKTYTRNFVRRQGYAKNTAAAN